MVQGSPLAGRALGGLAGGRPEIPYPPIMPPGRRRAPVGPAFAGVAQTLRCGALVLVLNSGTVPGWAAQDLLGLLQLDTDEEEPEGMNAGGLEASDQ
ncbi:hypothetical protein ABZW30_08945 [Kitasatospora sp. NPDC004669]|uniref:hypothetical protein n=1 Tax=Kitasatospora sp. NPDC004669 TaxID=3154555 RepID=UPI0033A1DF28